MMTFFIGIQLHIYQPPTQIPHIMEKIFVESYLPLIELLERSPSAFFSLDLAKSLGERLPADFLNRIGALYRHKRIELVNTCAYHYLAPLTPKDLLKRQLQLNADFYRKHFIGDDPLPGIFLPELAFAPNLPLLLREIGYKWCMADDDAFERSRQHLPGPEQVPQNWIPQMSGVGILLRSSLRSKEIAFAREKNGATYAHMLIAAQKEWGAKRNHRGDTYLIIAMDGETFGHHHPGAIEQFLQPFCEEIGRRADAAIVPLGEIYKRFEKRPAHVPSGSWSTDGDPCPYPLWNHPHNPFHRAWNEFITLSHCLAPWDNMELPELLDTAFYSCSPWQYSHGHKEVAAWCLPAFQKIAQAMPQSFGKERLFKLIGKLRSLTQ